MKIFKIAVTETYRKVVSVQANNEKEAHQRAWDAWLNTEIILDMNDFEGAQVYAIGEGVETDKKFPEGSFIEGHNYKLDEKGKGTAKNKS